MSSAVSGPSFQGLDMERSLGAIEASLGVYPFDWVAGSATLDLPAEAAAALGLAPGSDVCLTALAALVDPEDRPALDALRDRLLAGEGAFELGLRLLPGAAGPRRLLLRGRARADARGRLTGVAGVAIAMDAGLGGQAAGLRQAQFLDVQDGSHDGFMVFESVRNPLGAIVDFRWVHVNAAGARIVGRPVESLVGARLLDLMPGNRASGLFDAYRRVVETGEPMTREVSYRHDGLDTLFRLSAARAGDGFAVTFADLSERLKAEQAARAVLDLIPQKVWVANPGGECDFFNHRWYEYTGAERGQTDGLGWRTFVHPDDLERTLEIWRRAEETDDRYEAEYRLRTAEGSYRWVLARALPYHDEIGQVLRWFGTCTDIHDYKVAQIELHATEERLALALAVASGIGVWEYDVRADRVTASDRFGDLFGVAPAGDGAPRGLGEYLAAIHPEDRPGVEAEIARVLSAGGPLAVEFRIVQPDGTPRWFMARGRCEVDAHGAPLRLPGALIDITDRKLAEESRELLAQELSHRIKNIFALVSSIVGFTARDAPGAAEYARNLRARIEALGRAHDCVRPGAGPGAGTVHTLLATLLTPYADVAEGRIRVSGEEADVGPQCATALALILHEAATNSAKYGALSSADGRVEVTTTREGDADFRITWAERGGPKVALPERSGFGTLMADRAALQLGGRLTRAWDAGGMRLDLALPREELGR